jgi:hypothetical protein
MSNFTKIFGLAGALVVFAGMASAQSTCTAAAPATNIIRQEGTTELIATLSINCTASANAGTASLQVYLSPSLPITSKVQNTSTGATEATILVNGVASANGGTVTGSTLNFTNIVVPANTAYTIQVTNVRVNATSVAVSSGIPPAISATAFISGSAQSLTPVALTFPNVAFVQPGLAAAKIYKSFTAGVFPTGTVSNSGATNFVTCQGFSTSSGAYFAVQINENFPSAFKAAGDEASSYSTGSNAVLSGTRLTINFTNVPANVALYVPTGVIVSTAGNGSIQLTNAAAGAVFANVTPTTSSSLGTYSGAVAPVTLSSGAGSATFEVRTDDLQNLDSYNVPVFAVSSANAVVPSSTPVSASVNFAPVGSTAIPNFAITASSNTLTGPTFNLCTTSLLFPFVTNQVGFDTGIAIANTSTDPFGTKGATAQAGTCTLNFYGAGAPSPSNVVSPNVPSGTVYTTVLSGIAAGFQGYMIAQCNFQYAHGFAFITDGVGSTGGLSQGYLAGIIPDVNQQSRVPNPLSQAAAGTGESLGN